MEANIWDTLKDNRTEHKLKPSTIVGQLNSASTYFKGLLKGRGMRSGGTIVCWKDRFNSGMEETWYLPFSMAESPRRRHPGAPSALNWLSRLFENLNK
jgi:hypothetical protein